MAAKRKKIKNGNVHPDDEPKLPVPVRKPEPHDDGPPHAQASSGTPGRKRRGTVHRRTKETDVRVALDLDGTGRFEVETGIPFFDHMLSAFARHALIDLKVVAHGDLNVDLHHTVEDVGLCIGRALLDAMGDRAGMSRFGEATIPFDETLVRCAIDFSGRPHLVFKVPIRDGRIGNFDTELLEVFMSAITVEARMNLHLILEHGSNRHHIVEACFKALARATFRAVEIDPRRMYEVTSTKGSLDW